MLRYYLFLADTLIFPAFNAYHIKFYTTGSFYANGKLSDRALDGRHMSIAPLLGLHVVFLKGAFGNSLAAADVSGYPLYKNFMSGQSLTYEHAS